jgi:hypothetical protein
MINQMSETMKKSLLLFLSLFFSCFFIPVFFISNNPTMGMDESSQMALNFALKNNLIFGKDFIFTLGPLGFLVNRTPAGVPLYLFILFDLFVWLNIVYLVYTILSKSVIAISIRVIFVSLLVFHGDITVLLLLILFFLMFDYLDSPKYFNLLNIIIISSLLFLIKLDTGILSIFFVTAFLGYLLITRTSTLRTVAAIFSSIVGLATLLIFLLNIDIISHISSGVSMISAYSDAVHITRTEVTSITDLIIGLASSLLLIVPFFAFIRKIFLNKRDLLLYLMILMFGLFLFKASFTGINDIHFFDFIILLAGMLCFFITTEKEKIFYYSLLPIILLTLIFTFRRESLTERISGLFRPDRIINNYVNSFRFLLGSSSVASFPEQVNQSLPPAVLSSVSQKTIDVMPGNISLLSSNGLNYVSRPVFHTKYVYSDDLDELNARFISQEGPQIMLVAPHSYDNKYFLYEEPRTKLELFRNYKVNIEKENWDYILLERRETPLSMKVITILDEEFAQDNPIELIDSKGIQIAYPEIEYSWMGALFKFLFWAPRLSVSLTLNDGSVRELQFSKRMSKSGLIINKYVEPDSKEDYTLFLNHFGRLSTTVKSVKFLFGSGWAFKNTFNLTIEDFDFSGNEAPIDPEHRPIEIPNFKQPNQPAIKANIEKLNIDKGKVDFFGWVFIDDSLSKEEKSYLLLEAKDHSLIYPLPKIYRPDVKDFFGKNANDSAGFDLTIYRDFLTESNYKIGFAFLKEGKVTKKIIIPGKEINSSINLIYSQLEKFNRDLSNKKSELKYNIEETKVTEKELLVTGWAFLEDKSNLTADSAKLILKSKTGELFFGSLTTGFRDDVSNYFKNSSLDSTGFFGHFSTERLPKGSYELGLLIQNKKTGSGGYSFAKQVSIGYPNEFILTEFKSKLNLVKRREGMNYEVEKIEDTHGLLKISGWAFMINQLTKDCEISILLRSDDDVIYFSPTKNLLRKDVTLAFKTTLDNSGFEATISKRNLKKGDYEIGILILYPNGLSASCFLDEYIEK